MESVLPLPLARLQNVPPPPAGVVSQGLARPGGVPVVAHQPLVGADPYAMSDQERSKYESLFPMYDSDRDGFVTGSEAVELFSKSRLPREVSFFFIPRRREGLQIESVFFEKQSQRHVKSFRKSRNIYIFVNLHMLLLLVHPEGVGDCQVLCCVALILDAWRTAHDADQTVGCELKVSS